MQGLVYFSQHLPNHLKLLDLSLIGITPARTSSLILNLSLRNRFSVEIRSSRVTSEHLGSAAAHMGTIDRSTAFFSDDKHIYTVTGWNRMETSSMAAGRHRVVRDLRSIYVERIIPPPPRISTRANMVADLQLAKIVQG